VQGQIRTADRAAVAPAFTSGLHLVAIALATIAILGAVLSYLALDPNRDPATR
jgi:hypothetical protein